MKLIKRNNIFVRNFSSGTRVTATKRARLSGHLVLVVIIFVRWVKERRGASLRESGELLSARAYVLSEGRVVVGLPALRSPLAEDEFERSRKSALWGEISGRNSGFLVRTTVTSCHRVQKRESGYQR